MKLLSLVFFITCTSLFANCASSQCLPLNRTLFNDCVRAGYNVSDFSRSRPQDEVSSLIAGMQRKFKDCSSLSTLMACSVHIPKCPNSSSIKPCNQTCRNFVSNCTHGSSEKEGLIALFRGLCELLPSNQCLSDHSNYTAAHGKLKIHNLVSESINSTCSYSKFEATTRGAVNCVIYSF